MIHGLQGAAKLVNNVGRDSCALDCTSCAYYEVSDGAYDKESSTNRSRKGPHGLAPRGLLRGDADAPSAPLLTLPGVSSDTCTRVPECTIMDLM
jgi:hypothetical protein